ncbi:MAG TPA: phosphodiester glycosidase family protein [Allosphingosinicella sp.]
MAGCEEAAEQANAPGPPEHAEAGHCRAQVFEGSQFTICRYDARTHRIELASEGDAGPLRTFEALERHLGERSRHLAFAMNAGMYDEEGRPIGLHIEQGERLKRLNLRDGPGNFHMKPNGVFAVDEEGRASILTSDAFARRAPPRVMWATQSGPMLVVGGALHPRISPDGESRMVRNGVGVANPRTAFFVISDDPVSFGRFARLFRDVLKCRDALFFDGNVSSLWDPAAGRRDAHSEVGPMIFVLRRTP